MRRCRWAGGSRRGSEPLRDAFADLFHSGAETGAALAVIHDGELVADLHGGWRDAARTRPWTPDTLVHVFSAGKAVVAAGLVRLVDRGALDLDDPVARALARVRRAREARHHRAARARPRRRAAGVPGAAAGERRRRLAPARGRPGGRARRSSPAGTAVAEHAMTYGHLVGELIRRVDGRMPGEYLRAELGAPWSLDLALGATPAERARTADLEYASPDWPASIGRRGRHLPAPACWTTRPGGWLSTSSIRTHGARRRCRRSACTRRRCRWPGSTPACSRAASWTACACSAPARRRASATTQAAGTDLLLGRHVNWGLGVQVEETGEWGMGGIGGCDAFAHPRLGYSYAYVTRRLGGFEPSERLIEALEACL